MTRDPFLFDKKKRQTGVISVAHAACRRRVCSASGEWWEEEKGNFFVNKFKILLRLFSSSRRPVRPPFLKKKL